MFWRDFGRVRGGFIATKLSTEPPPGFLDSCEIYETYPLTSGSLRSPGNHLPARSHNLEGFREF